MRDGIYQDSIFANHRRRTRRLLYNLAGAWTRGDGCTLRRTAAHGAGGVARRRSPPEGCVLRSPPGNVPAVRLGACQACALESCTLSIKYQGAETDAGHGAGSFSDDARANDAQAPDLLATIARQQ